MGRRRSEIHTLQISPEMKYVFTQAELEFFNLM